MKTQVAVQAKIDGYYRLGEFVGRGKLVPMSTSTWWAGVASGKYPQPVRFGKRMTMWRASDIAAMLAEWGA